MAYIGRQNLGGAYRQLDDISSGFDGSDTTHTMQVNSANVTVGDVNQIILSLGGVIQKPGTDFTVSGSTLTFTTAPAANTSFFAILLGSDNGGTVTPTDGSVTSDKLVGNLVTPGTLDVNGQELILDADADTSITADTDDQIDIKIGGADDFAFKANNFEVQSGSTIDMNGQELILDADGDTSITADTDDKIDFRCGGLDTIQMNKFGQIKTIRESATSFGGSINFQHQRGTTASPSVVNSGDTIGGLISSAYDGTAYLDSARILFQVDGTPGDDDMPTRIVFQTTADGTAGTLGEVMRLRNDTDVVTCDITSSATTDTTAVLHLLKPDETHSSSTRMIGFEVGGQGRGTILNGTSDSGSPSFGTGSDRRLKKNITAYTGGYDKIKSIPVQTWDEQFTNATGVKGWIADELDDIFPDAVTGAKDATKTVTNAIISEHGNSLKEGITEEEFNELKANGQYANCTWSASKVVPAFQMSAPLKFFPDVVQALQAAITKIETLEADVKTLKGE